MKILILSPFENSLTRRGNRNILIYNELRSRGHNVDYITCNFDHALKEHIEASRFDFEKVIDVRGYQSNTSFKRLLTHFDFVIKSRKLLKNNKYDIVFLSSIPPEMIFIIPVSNRKKVIFDVRDIWPDALLGYKNSLGILGGCMKLYFNIINILSAKYVDLAFMVAKGYEPWLQRYSINNTRFMPLGFRNEIRSKKSRLSSTNVAIYAGGLTPQFDISNMAKLIEKYGIKVHVFGSGSLEDKYRCIENICLKGVVSREDVNIAMDNADYLLFPNNANAKLPNKAFDYYITDKDVIFESEVSEDVKELFDNMEPWKDGLFISSALSRDKEKIKKLSQAKIINAMCDEMEMIF